MTQQNLLWRPSAGFGPDASHALKHLAPQLVGRLPRYRIPSIRAALRLAGSRVPKLPNPLSPKNPLAIKPLGAQVAFPQPVIPRTGMSFTPPAGMSPPKAPGAGLISSGDAMTPATPLNTKLPPLPKLP